jgi:hypothetical protein
MKAIAGLAVTAALLGLVGCDGGAQDTAKTNQEFKAGLESPMDTSKMNAEQKAAFEKYRGGGVTGQENK